MGLLYLLRCQKTVTFSMMPGCGWMSGVEIAAEVRDRLRLTVWE